MGLIFVLISPQIQTNPCTLQRLAVMPYGWTLLNGLTKDQSDIMEPKTRTGGASLRIEMIGELLVGEFQHEGVSQLWSWKLSIKLLQLVEEAGSGDILVQLILFLDDECLKADRPWILSR